MEIGQKIHIEGGPRSGDWEVIGLNERKVKLRCPFSLREFELYDEIISGRSGWKSYHLIII
jgi:hypothetical protein